MTFNLADYEPVEARLARFWADHPNGRVSTTLERFEDGQVLFHASVWFDATDAHPAATGYAHEVVTARGVNATSAVENCETSAIGRALANAGYATKGKRPSREEMVKAQRQAERPPVDPKASAALLDDLLAKIEAAPADALDGLRAELKAASFKMTDADVDLLRGAYTARTAATGKESA